MSYTELYKFKSNGEAEHHYEFKNSWRGAMCVWKKLEEKYLPKLQYGRFGDKMKEVWDLQHSEKLDLFEKICLLSTFDNVVVRKENFPRLISAFRAFQNNSSLPEQAEIILKLQDDDDCIGIAWNQTSINADDWHNFNGYTEEDEVGDCDAIPYNLLTQTEHWFLFDYLNQLTNVS